MVIVPIWGGAGCGVGLGVNRQIMMDNFLYFMKHSEQ